MAALKSAIAANVEPSAMRRFGLNDVEDMGLWLIGRLRERYPSVSDRTLIGWLRGLVSSNEHLFLRARESIGLFQMSHRPLDPRPFIQEIMVLSRDGSADDGKVLYAEAARWGASMGASEIEVRVFSDVPHSVVREVMGAKPHVRERVMFRLPDQPT